MRLWHQMWEWIIGVVKMATLFRAQRKVLYEGKETIARENVDSDFGKDDYERDMDIIDNVDRVVPFLKKSENE